MTTINWNFQDIHQKAQEEINTVSDAMMLEGFRIRYLGRKGLIQEMFDFLKRLSIEDRPAFGKNINQLRDFINQLIKEKNELLNKQQTKGASHAVLDITLPAAEKLIGHKHILTQTTEEICGLFETLGFVAQEGPEIETEFNNFTALNIPVDHPSRDAFDTFYLEAPDPKAKDRFLLLRSHTSPGQIRIMKTNQPPLAVVIPGKVYRPDAVDASHSFMFHQIEGLLVDTDVKFSDLKGLLATFCQRFFGLQIKMRFRPHFFPFTEPSAEVDIS